ncbi:MAG: hypothetical protein E7274_02275 [Pseudobutyrivibrio ruminis]|uniref:hypothetical protein n=1 Tax=Pseudobutyrivibrio ruminis TaxID=46206 RepID=UPI0026EC7306|nr:hypothetical protein [Pseudobutyrivibrio ruminis]MBE5912868.1 hypothetical protein [Pseudobutyrivibrio ruminis]
MKVDIECENSALIDIIQNANMDLFLDANFFIPPDRSKLGCRTYTFESFKKVWLNPIFNLFDKLYIHESVDEELINEKVRAFTDEKVKCRNLIVCSDNDLSEQEVLLMEDMKNRLSIYSKYDSFMDCSSDRGEVFSLSYMAVKGFTYFGANDALPIRLIKNANKLGTGLDDMSVIQMYEIIYVLYKKGYESDGLRNLYKYQYYLTKREKMTNPPWGKFIEMMDEIYMDYFK